MPLAGTLTTKLWTTRSDCSKVQALSKLQPKFPNLHALQLRQEQLTGEHLKCCGHLPKLAELCLPYCFSIHSQLQAEGFEHLQQLTSLHLHLDRDLQMRPKDLPQGLFQPLTSLQHVNITGMCSGEAPFADLACLPQLKSFRTGQVHLGMTILTGLRELHITRERPFHLFEEDFSSLSQLSKLQVGSQWGNNKSDILSLHVFPQLHSLVIAGPFKNIFPGKNPGRLQRWDALTTLTTVERLYLKQVDHVYETFSVLGRMTQLTCLSFSSCNQFLKPQLLNEALMGLSSLVKMRKLDCKFLCSAFQLKGEAHIPEISVIGDLLRYSLSFCNLGCACQFGCKCTLTLEEEAIDREGNWCTRHRNCSGL